MSWLAQTAKARDELSGINLMSLIRDGKASR